MSNLIAKQAPGTVSPIQDCGIILYNRFHGSVWCHRERKRSGVVRLWELRARKSLHRDGNQGKQNECARQLHGVERCILARIDSDELPGVFSGSQFYCDAAMPSLCFFYSHCAVEQSCTCRPTARLHEHSRVARMRVPLAKTHGVCTSACECHMPRAQWNCKLCAVGWPIYNSLMSTTRSHTDGIV